VVNSIGPGHLGVEKFVAVGSLGSPSLWALGLYWAACVASSLDVSRSSDSVDILVEVHGLVVSSWVVVSNDVDGVVSALGGSKSNNLAALPHKLGEVVSVSFEFVLDEVIVLDLVVPGGGDEGSKVVWSLASGFRVFGAEHGLSVFAGVIALDVSRCSNLVYPFLGSVNTSWTISNWCGIVHHSVFVDLSKKLLAGCL
jgi:hypothetical protein